MLSARGAITTNVAMVECAAGQNTSPRKDVFLLSELEKVWVALCVLARRLLLDGKNVQIPHFGSFWVEDRFLVADLRQKYYTRSLLFGVEQGFATRYGIDTARVPLEKSNRPYARVTMSDIVDMCSVPARTASMALKEFFLYVGEGLHCGRVFHITLPGVASLVLKRERLMVSSDWEMQTDMLDIDSRKWPPEIKVLARQKLEEGERGSSSRASSRPTSSSRAPSRSSWENEAPLPPRPVFVPTSAHGKLFSDIEKEAERRRVAQQEALEREEAAQRAQHRVDRLILRENEYADHFEDEREVERRLQEARTYTYRPSCSSGENIYNAVRCRHDEEDEPDIEAVVEVTASPAVAERSAEVGRRPVQQQEQQQQTATPRPLGAKDAQLERVLRKEEPFSRPISRRSGHEPTSVRALIYGDEQQSSASKENNAPVADAVVHHGRKRFDHNTQHVDHVKGLLQA